MTVIASRDYSLTGAQAAEAERRGLANGEWFQANIDPARLRQLMVRTNGRAGFDTALWVACIAVTAALAWNLRNTWWAVPVFMSYGALVGGSSDARWHECGHGTAFKTGWLNDLVYYPASFMIAREATYWRWSHFRHHTDTIIVGRDPEIIFARPPSFRQVALTFSNVVGGPTLMLGAVRHATVGLSDVALQIVPERDQRRVVWEARAYVVIWLGVIALSLATWSPWPVLFVGGPTIYGAWLMVFFGITQHAGLREDVLDHRHSTRTVYMNPIFRFLYLNMNYHVEHHMFPAVPYRALPQLHAEIADQLPEAMSSTAAAYREIFRAIGAQRNNPTWELPDRHVPEVRASRAQVVQAFEWVDSNEWVDLGPANLGHGEVRSIDIGEHELLLACDEHGGVHLVDRTCTHGDADLSRGTIVGCEIECPKHNGRFDLRTGDGTRRPIQDALQTYPVRVRSGRVETRTEVDA